MSERTQAKTDEDMQHAHEPERHVGFTGTRHGMTTIQAEVVSELIGKYDWLHHGDCKGADHEAHQIATLIGVRTEGHPPINEWLQAFCVTDRTNDPKPYLDRNRDIVNAGERLIAAPRKTTEDGRSGTWSTIRYAKRLGKPVTIVFPDGSVRDE